MSFTIAIDAGVMEGVRAGVMDQLGKGAEELVDRELGIHERVHQIRKRFKKIRAVLRLARGPMGSLYKEENVYYRDAGRRLSKMRDAHAMLESLERMEGVYGGQLAEGAFSRLREGLRRRRDEMARSMELEAVLEEMEGIVNVGMERLEGWSWEGDLEGLRAGLSKSYRRGQEAMEEAYASDEDEDFHEWRKRSKYHRYHLRFLRELWPEVLNAYRHRYHELTDILGEVQDIRVLSRVLLRESERWEDERGVQLYMALGRQRKLELKAIARPLGEQLFAEGAGAMADRVMGLWWGRRAEEALEQKLTLR